MNDKLRAKFEEFLAELENDADIVEYKEAKKVYESDKAVGVKINEYSVQSSLLDQESNKPEKDTLLIESLKKRVNELYNEIIATETMKRMTVAEEKMGGIFSEINAGIQQIIAPEMGCHDGSCGGGCSSCSGCH